ncbi:unnamed protein product, partial [Sphacelaria rigidula]
MLSGGGSGGGGGGGSTVTSTVGAGELSPIDEENPSVVTINPMLAHPTKYCSSGGQKEEDGSGGQNSRKDSWRKGGDEEDEPEGMFADAAIVAELAAAAAKEAQYTREAPAVKPDTTTPKGGWKQVPSSRNRAPADGTANPDKSAKVLNSRISQYRFASTGLTTIIEVTPGSGLA